MIDLRCQNAGQLYEGEINHALFNKQLKYNLRGSIGEKTSLKQPEILLPEVFENISVAKRPIP
jgi:hypothetical protein